MGLFTPRQRATIISKIQKKGFWKGTRKGVQIKMYVAGSYVLFQFRLPSPRRLGKRWSLIRAARTVFGAIEVLESDYATHLAANGKLKEME